MKQPIKIEEKRQAKIEQQKKEDAEMRRMFRKRGGDPVEELELQTGTALKKLLWISRKGRFSEAVPRMPRRLTDKQALRGRTLRAAMRKLKWTPIILLIASTLP